MHRKTVIANSILWATSIIVAAIFNAPTFLTVIALPALAVMSLVVGSQSKLNACRT